MPTAVSIFSGCGGFDWGAQQAGVDIIWANDVDKHAAAAYQSIFPNVDFTCRDIREIEEFPEADILIGCYPCTGFSLGSRRKWRDNETRDLHENNTNFLFQEFLRALRQVRPKYLFVENVIGMLTASNGWFLNEQLEGFRKVFGDCGYKVSYDRLNASKFGVGQARKRIFIVGVRDDIENFDYKFPKPTHGPKTQNDFVVLQDLIGGMEEWPDGEFFDYPFHGHYLTRNRKRRWDEVSYTIVANHHHVPLHPIGEPMKYIKKDTWELQGQYNRRLSWRECALIQGLPPEISPSGRLLDKYRVVGNAVPPQLGHALVLPVIENERRINQNPD